jgi:hypothetical protein
MPRRHAALLAQPYNSAPRAEERSPANSPQADDRVQVPRSTARARLHILSLCKRATRQPYDKVQYQYKTPRLLPVVTLVTSIVPDCPGGQAQEFARCKAAGVFLSMTLEGIHRAEGYRRSSGAFLSGRLLDIRSFV